MKVLVKGIVPKSHVATTTCLNCKSVVEVDKDECTKITDEGRTFYKSSEKCPVCNTLHFCFLGLDFKPKAD